MVLPQVQSVDGGRDLGVAGRVHGISSGALAHDAFPAPGHVLVIDGEVRARAGLEDGVCKQWNRLRHRHHHARPWLWAATGGFGVCGEQRVERDLDGLGIQVLGLFAVEHLTLEIARSRSASLAAGGSGSVFES